jgi:hypothetical protein
MVALPSPCSPPRALACNPATHNAVRDQAQAAEKQAESLRQLVRI